jgi:ABC-type branched-subunit amino acid transport system ATPase component
MKIKLKNLGAIKQAEFEIGDLTIICGKNNTGKTYTTYALFGFLDLKNKFLRITVPDASVEDLLHDGSTSIDLMHYATQIDNILQTACQEYSKQLAITFASEKSLFQTSKFSIEIAKNLSLEKEFKQTIGSGEGEMFSLTKEENSNDLLISLLSKEKITFPHHIIKDIIANFIIEILFDNLLPNVFIASAERTGAAIFKDELDFARTRLLKEMHKNKDIDPLELLFKNYHDYALPVEKNVEFQRKLSSISKKDSFITKEHPEILKKFNRILGGKYQLDKDDNLNFHPEKSKVKLEIGESSSAVRSLLDLGFYMKHIAKPNDLLIIDEPELNLHPENQRLIAQVLANLVNIGIKVFITTHSDYIIKEFSTLIMLNADSENDYLKTIASQEGYCPDDLLKAQQVKMYVAKKESVKLDGNSRKTKNNTLTSVEIDDKLGIGNSGFDDTIDKMNKIQQSIIWQ